MRRVSFVVYNLGPPSDPDRGPLYVKRELNALANVKPHDGDRKRPKVIGTMEAIGRPMPEIAGYRKIRDTRNSSRANLCLYVLDRLDLGETHWIQHRETWPRMNDHTKTHPPRATLVQEVEDWHVALGHAPVGHGTAAARTEWLTITEDVLRNPAPVLLLSDPNGLGEELRRRVPSSVAAGTRIEAVHARHAVIDAAVTPSVVNGVPLLSDHHQALLGRVSRRN
jgi:hypothetical protein